MAGSRTSLMRGSLLRLVVLSGNKKETICSKGVNPMPLDNYFHHSVYSRKNPGDRVVYRDFESGAPSSSSEWQEGMAQAGAQLNAAGVKGVVFVSGLPIGDLFGIGRLDEGGVLKRGYSRGIPGMESLLALLRPETNGFPKIEPDLTPPLSPDEQTQHRLDTLVKETGNFSTRYVHRFQQSINHASLNVQECSRYLWLSVHHHLGRLQAALDLYEYLRNMTHRLTLGPGSRLLVQAHGQAGEVMAFLSNVIYQGESPERERIFDILAAFVKKTQLPSDQMDRLHRLFHSVTYEPFLNGAALDIVTYGTPIRYGWELGGIGHLVHLVNHRPVRGDGKRWLAKMELPQIAWEIPMMAGGDYVQQLAVAGTDMVSTSEAEQQAELDLREILEPYDGFEQWLECARRGTRCANDGQCILVDYKVTGNGGPMDHLFGHGCYTHLDAMLFHTKEIIRTMYQAPRAG